jgi:hypothetical protein
VVQIAGVVVTAACGLAYTVTVSVAAAKQLPNVYLTVKFVVVVALTVIDGVVALLLHRYVPPAGDALAASVALPPWQYAAPGSVTVGILVTVTLAVSEQPDALVQI